MKTVFFLFASSFILLSCGNQGQGKSASRVLSDSLFRDVMDLHNIGMGKIPKITKLRTEVAQRIDSLKKLPVAARKAAAPYMVQLDSLSKQLEVAEVKMNTWMTEFKTDSANNATEQWIRYLRDEKEKVGLVKELILSSLKNADTLLKK